MSSRTVLSLNVVFVLVCWICVGLSSIEAAHEHSQIKRSAQQNSVRAPSTYANEFVVGFMRNYIKPSNYRYALLRLNNTYLFVTTDHPDGVTVTISFNGEETVHNVSPSGSELIAAKTIKLKLGTRVQGSADRNKGIRVKADGSKHITVQCFSEEVHSVDGFTALPCTHLPTVSEYVYYAVSVPKTSIVRSANYREPHSMFLIVACENNTEITITPSQRIQNPNNPLAYINPGQNVTVVLEALQTLQIEHLEDLTSSRVVSSAPISFISGHECGNVPYNVRECDHLVEQLPPTVTWGKEFISASTAGRTTFDTVMVISSRDNTTVHVTCRISIDILPFTVNFRHTLAAGGTANITLPPSTVCHFRANKPILVIQFTAGRYAESRSSGTGDPFMLLVPAVSQYLNEVIFSSAKGFDLTALSFDNYLNVFVPELPDSFNASSVEVNGVPLEVSNWVQVVCAEEQQDVCGYSATFLAPTAQAVKVRHTNPEGRIGVTAYGISFLETYGYIGGMKITLNEGPYIIEPVQTSFIILYNTPLCLSCDLSHSYDAPEIIWRFNDLEVTSDDEMQTFDNGTLCIHAATITHAGNYSCHAGHHNLVYSVSVTTGIIIESPTCRPKPSTDSVVLIGIGAQQTSYIDLDTTALEICCPTNGNLDSLQWLADGARVTNGSKYFVGANYLRVSGSFQDGCVTYTCRASFPSRTVSQSIEVCAGRIHPPDNVTIDGPMEVLVGQPFTLTCSATGFPLPTIIWSRFGELLPENIAANHTNGTLSLVGLRESDELQFCCDVGNSRGTRSKCINLILLVPPKINPPPFLTNIITSNQPILPLPDLPLNNLLKNNLGLAHAGQIIMIHKAFDLRVDCEIEKGNPAPKVSWWMDNDKISNSSKYEVYGNGTLVMRNVDQSDDGVYTCVAVSDSGSHRINTSVSVIVSPEIARPLPPFHSPGSCKDATKNNTIHQQVGLDLCTLAGSTTKLYLFCEIATGVPKPNITWLKDYVNINSSDDFTLFENGTLLVEGLRVPVESKVRGRVDLSGLYTCVAINIAGVTNASSYILSFGSISEDVRTHHLQPLHHALYDNLHSNIAKQIEDLSTGEQHLALLTAGRLLNYDDYNPGRGFDGSEDTIPQNILETIFKLTDFIPDSRTIVTDLDESHSLSKTYEYLVHLLRVIPVDIRPSDLQDARTYLQTKVEDLGLSGDGTNTAPRLSLYLKYKNNYYGKKLDVENQIDSKRNILTGYHFSEWYDRYASVLNAKVDDAYLQWVLYGEKDEVEKWLKLLKLKDDSTPIDYAEALEEAHALLVATKERSRFKEDSLFRPVKLFPSHWFKVLQNRVDESIEQLQYHIANLESQKQVLVSTSQYLDEEAKRAEYCNRPTIQFPIPISCPKDPFNDPSSVVNQLNLIRYFLDNEVERSEMFRYQCLVTRNPEDCHLYSLEHDVVTNLMNTYADLYFFTQIVTTARNHRDISSPVIVTTLNSLENRIEFLETLVQGHLIDTADRDVNDEEMLRGFTNRMRYDFRSTKTIAERHPFDLPQVIRNRLLWHFEYSSSGPSYHADDSGNDYKVVIDYLNSIDTNVTADLLKVDIKRRWFRPVIFKDKHLRLKNHSILVSPGIIHPPQAFRDTVNNGSYLLPLYPSSLILATNIKLKIHSPFPYFILPTLLRMSYDLNLEGGFGPFVFGSMFDAATGSMKFRVTVRGDDIEISLPGTQVLGYLCDIVPQHPVDPGVSVRSKRFVESERNEPDLKENKATNKFNQWLSLKTKEHPARFETEDFDVKGVTILPSATVTSYDSVAMDSYGNETMNPVQFKTEGTN